MIIIDVKLKKLIRLIGLYRIFNPLGTMTQQNYFKIQLGLIKQATESAGNIRVMIIGDFNLNEEMKYRPDYSHKHYYEDLIEIFDPLSLIQMVKFKTWSRLVNGNWKSSILDLEEQSSDGIFFIPPLSPY